MTIPPSGAEEAADDEEVDQDVALWGAALSEVQEAGRELEELDTPFRRRGYVRAVFAAVEAFAAGLRNLALRQPDLFQTDELTLLREVSPYLERGRLAYRAQKVPLRDSLTFGFGCYMRLHGSQTKLELDEDWNNFLSSVRVRDRLMHPKSTQDFIVTDAELEGVRRVAEWLMEKTLNGMVDGIPNKFVIVAGLLLALYVTNARKQAEGEEGESHDRV